MNNTNLKVLSTQQPYFLTWMGTFYKIHRSQVFVLLDNVKLRTGDEFSLWNRNTLANGDKNYKLHIPIFFQRNQSANEALIDQNKKWIGKHLSMMEDCYGDLPFFTELFPLIRDLYMVQHKKLIDFNYDFIILMCDYLGMQDKKIVRMSELMLDDMDRNKRVLKLCSEYGCNSYLAEEGARNYIREEMFRAKNICVTYINFKDQFDNYNVLDILFREGKSAFSQYIENVELMQC